MRLLKIAAILTLFIGIVALSWPRTPVMEGKNFSIAGENTASLCRLLNYDVPCTGGTRWGGDAYTLASSGKVDLAVVPAKTMTEKSLPKAFIFTSTDKKHLLVSRPDLPDERATEIGKTLQEFMKGKIDKIGLEFRDTTFWAISQLNLVYFLKSRHAFPLHPMIAALITEKLMPHEKSYLSGGWCGNSEMVDFMRIGDVASVGMPIAPFLIQNLTGDNPYLAYRSALALGAIKTPDNSSFIAPLTEIATEHQDFNLRSATLNSLARLHPVSPKTLSLLESVVTAPADSREQTELLLNRHTLAQRAAEALANADIEAAHTLFSRLLNSPDEYLQVNAIVGMNAMKNLLQRDSAKSDNKTLLQLMELTQIATKAQEKVSPQNAMKIISLILQLNAPENISQKSLLLLAKDAQDNSLECNKDDSFLIKYCKHAKRENALFMFRALHSYADAPEVYIALSKILREVIPKLPAEDALHGEITPVPIVNTEANNNAVRDEYTLVIEVLNNLAPAPGFPPELAEQLLKLPLYGEETPALWAALAQHFPELKDRFVARLEEEMAKDNNHNSQIAEALTSIGHSQSHSYDAFYTDLNNALKDNARVPNPLSSLPAFARMGKDRRETAQLLAAFLSYGEHTFTADPSRRFSLPPPVLVIPEEKQRRPLYLFSHEIYDTRRSAALAMAELPPSPELLHSIEEAFKNEVDHAFYSGGCSINPAFSYLNDLAQTYSTLAPENDALLTPTMRLMTTDAQGDCRRFAVHFLGKIGASAAIALPEIEKQIIRKPVSLNTEVFVALEEIGTPEALAMANKYAKYNVRSQESKQEPPVNLLIAMQAYYASINPPAPHP